MKHKLILYVLLLPLLAYTQKPELGLPYGHTQIIHNIAFSADGQRLYTGSEDESHKLWDLQSGKLLQTSAKLNSNILPGARVSPTLRYVSCSMGWTDGSSWFFDFNKPDDRGVYGLSITSYSADEQWGMNIDGQLVALANPDEVRPAPDFQPEGYTPNGRQFYKFTEGNLQLWDVATLQLQKTLRLEGSKGLPSLVAYGNIIQEAVVPENFDAPAPETYRFWKAENGEFLYEFAVPDQHLLEDVSPDGKYVLLTDFDGRVKLFDPVRRDTVVHYNRPGEGQEHYMFETPPDSKISPDGRLIARGRGDGSIYLQELMTGKVIRVLRAHNWAPVFLQFNADNTLLCGTREGTARIWDLTAGAVREAIGDRHQDIYTSSFAPIDERRLLFYQTGGALKYYDLEQGTTEKLHQFPEGSREYLLNYLPDQQTAWFRGIGENFNYVNKSYNFQQEPTQIDVQAGTGMLGISPEGTLGVSARLEEDEQQNRVLKGQVRSLPDGRLLRDLAPAAGTYMSPNKAIFSADRQKVLVLTDYELQDGTTSYVWDLNTGRLVQELEDPEGGYVDCGAFSPDGKTVMLGSWSRSVYWFDLADGKLLHTFKGHSGRINALSFSPDGKRMASGADDGTVKIWDLERREEIATLIHIDRDDWIVLGPDGLFDASQPAMSLLYYIIKTPNKQEVIEFEQLKARYYEPGLLQKLLGYSSERIRSVEGLDEVPLYPEVRASIEQDQLDVQLKARSGGIGQLSIFVNGKEIVHDANPERKTAIRFDLKQAQAYLLRHPDSTNLVSLRAYNRAGWLKSPAIVLPYHPSSWSRGSGSSGGSSQWQGQFDPKMYVVTIGTSDYTGTQLDLRYAAQDATAMALALKSVGSNLFANGDSLEVHCLTTASPGTTGLEDTGIQWQFASKENVKATLSDIQKKAKAEDVLLVYVSGHGLTHGATEQSQFYYLTSSVASEDMIDDEEVRRQYTISSGELTDWINQIPALKQVLVIDACNSGKVVESLTGSTRNLNSSQIRALDRMKDRTGMFILSGSAADKVSYEASEYGQGLLTYSLLQGMLGVATRQTADGDYIDVMKLFQYARDEVPRLAATINGIQTPMLGFPTTGASFDIGIFDQNTNIPIGNKKPVIIRPNFLNQVTLRDDLELVKLLEAEFRKETEKGKDADLIYVNTTDYPQAYTLNGLYSKNDGEIKVTVRLFENGEHPHELEIPATNDTKRLVRLILREVKRAISNPDN